MIIRSQYLRHALGLVPLRHQASDLIQFISDSSWTMAMVLFISSPLTAAGWGSSTIFLRKQRDSASYPWIDPLSRKPGASRLDWI